MAEKDNVDINIDITQEDELTEAEQEKVTGGGSYGDNGSENG
jgi:hypothetical protein